MTQTADNLTPTGIMTAESLCIELRELITNRRAIDIIADRHECTYTDIIKIIGASAAFEDYDYYHSRPHPVVNAPMYRLKKADEIRDDAVLMYNSGMCQRQIAAKLHVSQTLVSAAITDARKAGVPIREYVPAGSRSAKGVVD